MPDAAYDFLSEDLIAVDGPGGTHRTLSLPDVLAVLSQGEEIEFSHLQAHQFHAWHAFLVQLGALALHDAGAARPFDDPGAWRAALLGLTAGAVEPWCLVVPDLTKPALLQPPVPEQSLQGWATATFPDEIDLLVTAKNHDVKASRIRRPTTDHWLYALVSVQTMDGFPGRNNYGIARMNGGYGNRACVATAKDVRWGSRFVRDLFVLKEARASTATEFHYAAAGGVRLLWMEPWNGTTSLSVDALDPWFIEVCRRMRLTNTAGTIRAYRVGTTVRRIDAEQRHGDLGDPWVPIRREDGAALTAKSLAYDKLHDVLFDGEYKLPTAGQTRAEDGDQPVILALVLARGQGGTEGLHERTIPVPPKARRLFATLEGRQRLGAIAKRRVEDAKTVRRSVLLPSLLSLVQGAPDKLDFSDKRVDPFTRRFDALVDRFFFVRLFADVDGDPSDTDRLFATDLLACARTVLDDGIQSLPVPNARWYRAVSRAEAIFLGASRRAFPQLDAETGDTHHERANRNH